jgi:hypothetical protein
MDRKSEVAEGETKFFQASKLWTANVCGAAVGGMVTGAVMSVISLTVLWTSPEIKNRFLAAAWLPVVSASLWAMYPGNWIASAPYAVKIIEGKGLWLYTFLKKYTYRWMK